MNRQETTQIITLLAGNYNSIAEKSKEQKQMMLNTWQECLGDLDYKLVLQAVKKTIIKSPFPPTIHDIRKYAVELINPIEDRRLEVWDECYKLICRGSVVTQEEFDKHSYICKKFLGSVNQLRSYARSDIDTINTVVKSSFLKQYEILLDRQKEENLLPENLRNIKELTQQGKVKEIGG